jgi:hypothetical protein
MMPGTAAVNVMQGRLVMFWLEQLASGNLVMLAGGFKDAASGRLQQALQQSLNVKDKQ